MKHFNNLTMRIPEINWEGIIFKWYTKSLNISQKQKSKYVSNYINIVSNVQEKQNKLGRKHVICENSAHFM